MAGALQGLRVIEMGHVVAGPFCGAMMADFGADVIKIERPGVGDGLRYMGAVKNVSFMVEGRGKKCVTLDLTKEKGKEILRKLFSTADVVIENYRPGVMEKLGFGWEELHKQYPRLILVSISGFGQTGPYRLRPGYDSIGMAMGGLSYVTGFAGGPPVRPGFIIGDYLTGLFAYNGAMTALYNRDVVGTGLGQHVDAALFEAVYRVSESTTSLYGITGKVRERIGNSHKATVPSGHFQTKDDRWLCMAVGNDKVFSCFCKAVGHEELLSDPRFQTQVDRVRNREPVEAIATEWIRSHTMDECLKAFGLGVPASPVYSIEDIVNDPQYRFRDDVIEVEDKDFGFGTVKMQGVVPKLSETPGEVKWPGTAMGKYNEAVYGELGYSAAEIERLKADGVI